MKLKRISTRGEKPLRNLTIFIAAIATVALIATSCGGSSESTDSASSETESSSASEPATEESQSSEAEEETPAPSQDLEVADDCPTASDARDDLFPGVMSVSYTHLTLPTNYSV